MAKKISQKNPSGSKEQNRVADVPVTLRLLDLKTQEINGNMTTLRLETRAGFSEVKSQMTKMMVILEEQNARNKVALDGYTIVYEKLQESDSRLEKIEKLLFETL